MPEFGDGPDRQIPKQNGRSVGAGDNAAHGEERHGERNPATRERDFASVKKIGRPEKSEPGDDIKNWRSEANS